ncbi:MAG: hypothetical protein K6D96_06880 [Acetatifactor sp.]|nr:hypothetical protein [Acetatifactor sp.]
MKIKEIIRKYAPYCLESDRKKREEYQYAMTLSNIPEPCVYNASGERMRVFYLQDKSAKFSYSFTAGQNPNSILWDRSNYMLPIHFYTDYEIFSPISTCKKKFGILLEPEAFLPDLYERIYNNPDLIAQYEAIFTHSKKVCDTYPNAKLYYGQGAWYGTYVGGGKLDEELYKKKSKLVSMVSSNKTLIESHKRRIEIAQYLKEHTSIDTFGNFDGGIAVKPSYALEDYMFSVVLENEISEYYFTEKLLNCMVSMTIPIYSGAMNIGEIFNTEGFIIIDKYSDLAEIAAVVDGCTKEIYLSKIDAIKENYEIAKSLVNMDDVIYNSYKELFRI